MVPGEMLDLNQNKTQLNHVKRPAAFSDCLVQKHFLDTERERERERERESCLENKRCLKRRGF
jgi:hypothetical protein